MAELFIIFIGVVLVNNFVLVKFLGLCPYIGVSRDLKSAVGMGVAVIFVMTMASTVTWFIYQYFLVPGPHNIWFVLLGDGVDPSAYDFTYLRTIAFILVIAALVQLVEMVITKTSPALHRALGIYLPLITTNCAVLGVAVLNVDSFFKGGEAVPWSFLKSLTQGFGAGVGFTLALILMASIRERLELADIPPALRGAPIAFLVGALMSMAFLGFTGLI
ncbi:MAG: Rnf-Nqr domain containing protein [Candidatus Auribacterota bacterium]|nr:Rnf-Nqr domain containing protein [Candidatus Auribacterota bacterium]